jgi:hypothetical protein
MRTHLRNIVGLAISNPHVVGANFEASHILHACESFAKASEQFEIACNNTNHCYNRRSLLDRVRGTTSGHQLLTGSGEEHGVACSAYCGPPAGAVAVQLRESG